MIDKAGLLFLLGLSLLGVNGCAGGGGESGTPAIPPVGGTNTPPSISGAPPAVATVGAMFAFKPTASDQDGDPLTFSIQNRPGWASFSNATGNLTGLPGSNDVGNYDNIIIAASDGLASSALDGFSLRVHEDGSTNTVPTITGTPPNAVEVGSNYTFVPNAADGDGDTLTFTVQNLPVWASFSMQTGALTGTPQNGSVGSYPDIVISVSDGRATASLAPFTITVQSNGSANSAPVISGTPAGAIPIGSIYTFAPTASDPDGDALTFFIEGLPVWAFFNSSTGEITGIPQAGNVGSYTDITITVSDGLASTSLAPFSITVMPSGANNRPPSISGSPASSVLVGSNFFFEPVVSDPDGDRLQFQITNFPVWASFSPATGALFGAPQVGDEGVYSNIVISVTDRRSTVSLAPFSITVSSNGAPTISGSPAAQVTVGSNYTFTPTAVDPDGDALVFSIRNRPSWANFNPATGTVSGGPQVGDEGIYSGIVIEVSDGVTTTPMAPFGIAVDANGSPVISGTPATQVMVGDNYQFIPVASDPEGDTLTFSMLGLPDWLSLDAATGALTGTPQIADVGVHGILVLVANDGYSSTGLAPFAITVSQSGTPVIAGSPPAQVNVGQTYSFTPTASDPNGDTLSFSIQNAPAWAAFSTTTGTLSGAPQAADIGAYASIVISVTDGQSSASLPAFTLTVNSTGAPMISGVPNTEISAGQSYSFTPASSDPDGDPLTFSIQNPPAWATFSTATGALSGTPLNSDAGTFANIIITVSDGTNTASLPAFSITVIGNAVPSISGTPATSVTIGNNYAFVPTAADADGDALTFSIQNRPFWASFSNATGALTGSPHGGNEGTYSNIVISVSDGQDSASLAAFAITVNTNGLPVISGTPTAQVDVGQNYSFTPTATDPDGDALTFTIQNRPAWATFSAATGTLSGTPVNGQQGTYGNIVIGVTDGQSNASLAPFSITVNGNSAPAISGSPATSVTIGEAYSFTPTASDADGDTLSFSIQGRPAWAAFSTTTGTLSGTPQSADAGLYGGIVITVSDGEDESSLTPFGITVATNAAPTISGTPATQVNVDAGYSFVPTASDPEGDTLTFSILNKPVWANFSTTTGTLSGTPDPGDEGTYSNIIISVSDGQSSAALPAFTLTVSQVSTGSASFTWTPPSLNEDGSTLADLAGYRFYYGLASGSYTVEEYVDSPGLSSHVIENLTPGTYYFALKAVNANGIESALSNEVSKVITGN